MAYEFEAVGWENFDGERQEGTPSDLEDTHGVLVHAHDDSTDDHQYFWAYTIEQFEDWAEWWVYIGGLIEMYGLELA